MNMVISKLHPHTKRDTLADVLQFLYPLMVDEDNVIILQKTQKLKKTLGIITTKMTQQARAIRNKTKTKPIKSKPPKHTKQSIKYVKNEIDNVFSENEDETNQNTVEQ
eukprot:529321_1